MSCPGEVTCLLKSKQATACPSNAHVWLWRVGVCHSFPLLFAVCRASGKNINVRVSVGE